MHWHCAIINTSSGSLFLINSLGELQMSLIIISIGYIIMWMSIAVLGLWAALSLIIYILERNWKW